MSSHNEIKYVSRIYTIGINSVHREVLPGMEWTVTLWLAARVNNRKALTNTVFAVKIFYVL